MTEPQALATGDLRDTPLGGLLYSIHTRRLTGSLVIAETAERRHCVAFQDGSPNKARLVDPIDLVGEILIEASCLTPEQLTESLEYSQQLGLFFGESAMMLGHTDSEAINQALIVQTARRVARLFALYEGAYGFYQEDFLASFGGDDNPVVDPLAIIAAGVRSSYDDARLTLLVKGLQDRPLIASVPPETIARFRFEQPEAGVVTALAQAQTLQDLLRTAGQPPQIVHAVVHCLHMTGLLVHEPGQGETAAPQQHAQQYQTPPAARPSQQSPRPPASTPPAATTPSRPVASTPPAATAPSRSPASAPPSREHSAEREPAPPPAAGDSEKSDRRLEAEALIAKGDEATYFELLGVTREATAADIQKAFAMRARKFHPDKCTGDMAEIRSQVASLFARMTVAKDTLKDPATRKNYLDSLDLALGDKLQGGARPKGAKSSESAEDQIIRRALEADEAFMKAKILLKRNQLEEAEKNARIAVEGNPEQGNAAALLAWIESRRRPRTANFDDLLARLQDAVKLAEKSEDAHFYLAQLLYQTGKVRKALDEFEEVMEINRDNIDAVRMVRILRKKRDEVIAQKKAQKSSGGGFFSSFFSDPPKKK